MIRDLLARLTTRDEERGASAVEYGLLVAAIAAMIVVVAFGLGKVVKEALFEGTCGEIVAGSPDISSDCS